MIQNPLKLWGLTTLVMAGIHGAACAAAPPVVPDLTKGAKNEGFQHWNMGPTGIRGGAFCQGFDTSASRQILVDEVAKGSPADGLLAAGDVILGVNGKPFDHDARRSLGEAITTAEETANKGQLKLVRWRAGNQQDVTLPLRVMGSYSPTSPYNCDKPKRSWPKDARPSSNAGFPAMPSTERCMAIGSRPSRIPSMPWRCWLAATPNTPTPSGLRPARSDRPT